MKSDSFLLLRFAILRVSERSTLNCTSFLLTILVQGIRILTTRVLRRRVLSGVAPTVGTILLCCYARGVGMGRCFVLTLDGMFESMTNLVNFIEESVAALDCMRNCTVSFI